MRTRALEAYWSGFTTWWIGALDRRWRRTDIGDRLRTAVLDVGTAIVADRHGPSDVRLALDQFAWLVDIAARTRFLRADEHQNALTAIGVVRGMCMPERAAPPSAPAVSPPTPA